MSQHFTKKSKAKPEISTASLPDIIFMLLIFFMVTTVLRETEVQVRTILPEAGSPDQDRAEALRLVHLDGAGEAPGQSIRRNQSADR